MIRSQRSPYGTSLLGACAVHHIRLGHGGMSALSPFYPQLRTLVGDAGTAASCQSRPNAAQQNPRLFDHRIRDREQPRRNGEPERFGGLEIDDKVEFGWL